MSSPGNESVGYECATCGTEKRPEKGWIFKTKDVQPKRIEDGELLFETKEGAQAYCSTECLREAEK